MDMDAFTLFTFLLRAPTGITTVELFGSWDNFSRPWPLQRDPVKGRQYWSACHSFDHIIFDGTCPNFIKPRSGGLKQGGKYWYFYRLDDSDEYCDPTEDTAKDCPLLPGQELNVLDIPLELAPAPTPGKGRSLSVDIRCPCSPTMTMNPDDRFKRIYRRPARLLRHYASSHALESHSSSESAGSDASPDSVLSPSSPLPTPNDPPSTALSLTESSFSDRCDDSPCPLRPFAPTLRADSFDRPPTRPGSDLSSRHTANLFYTAGPNPSFVSDKALPALPVMPADSDPTAIGDGLGISATEAHPSQKVHAGPATNFARPFYAAPTSSLAPSPAVPTDRASSPDEGHGDVSVAGMRDMTAFPSPNTSASGSSMASPSFTADTVSTPGFISPHRLSAQFNFELHSDPLVLTHDDHGTTGMSMDQVERRFSRLRTGDEDPMDDAQHADGRSADAASQKDLTPRPSLYMAVDDLDASRISREPEFAPHSSSLTSQILGELSFLGQAIH